MTKEETFALKTLHQRLTDMVEAVEGKRARGYGGKPLTDDQKLYLNSWVIPCLKGLSLPANQRSAAQKSNISYTARDYRVPPKETQQEETCD